MLARERRHYALVIERRRGVNERHAAITRMRFRRQSHTGERLWRAGEASRQERMLLPPMEACACCRCLSFKRREILIRQFGRPACRIHMGWEKRQRVCGKRYQNAA